MTARSLFVRWILWPLALLGLAATGSAAPEPRPVYIGIDAEFGHANSTSAEAIRRGVMIAVNEINQAGGVLGGRPLAVEIRDNRSVPARAIQNFKDLAALPDLVAVFCGKFSPVVQEVAPLAHQLKVPYLDPWAAADDIIDNGQDPNYVFRLSLRDSWALQVMMESALNRGYHKVGLLLPNTGWGRSSLRAAENYAGSHQTVTIAKSLWYNWGDKSLLEQYRALQAAGAAAIILVANETEGSILAREVAALPEAQRLPILSHWGVTGGQFFKLAGDALAKLDFSVVQTYSFIGAADPVAVRVVKALREQFNVPDARQIESPVGIAHAYDLTHLLARALDLAGSTDGAAVRGALERIDRYDGLVKNYRKPFSPQQHEALGIEHVFMARYAADGAIERIKNQD